MKTHSRSAGTTTSRRRFLKTTAAAGLAGLGAGSLSARSWANVQGANGDLRIAVIGFRSQGGGHINRVVGASGARLAAICDVDQAVIDRRVADLKGQNIEPKVYTDYRELCQDPDIDGVMIATPNHTHTLIALTAIAHGKHVYVEKPVAHNIHEGRKLVEGARKRPELVVTHGQQGRSDTGWHRIMEWLQDKPLGEVVLSRGLNYKARQSIGSVGEPKEAPSTVDYNLWCGPREMTPVNRRQFHYDWHWQWDFGNGDIGNQGPHQLDVARWPLNQPVLPPRVMSLGQRWGYEDDGETANNQLAFFDYQPVPLLFDNRGLPMREMDWRVMPVYKGVRVGNVIHCEGGHVIGGKAYDSDGKEVESFSMTGGGSHLANWLGAIRAGKLEDPQLDLLHGHLAGGLAHLANLSYRLGKELDPNEVRERLQGDKVGQETYENFLANLEANGIDPSQAPPVVGPWLELDPETEEFRGEFADAAKALDAGVYRDEFKLPEIS